MRPEILKLSKYIINSVDTYNRPSIIFLSYYKLYIMKEQLLNNRIPQNEIYKHLQITPLINYNFIDTSSFILEIKDLFDKYKGYPKVEENFKILGFYEIEKMGNIDELLFQFNELKEFNVEDCIDLYESLNVSDRSLNDFFTPKNTSQLISQMIKVDNNLEDKEEISIYDPSVGIGRLVYYSFIQLKELYPNKNINIFGFDLSLKYTIFTQSILDLINFNHSMISRCNTIETNVYVLPDINSFSMNELEKCDILFPKIDIVISNPPYNKKGIELQFVEHIEKLNPDRVFMILPTSFSSLNKSQSTRKRLLENNLFKTIVSLPERLFLNTSIPTDLIELEKSKTDTKIFMINGRDEKFFIKQGKHNIININEVIEVYKPRCIEI